MNQEKPIQLSLLAIRIGIVIVFMAWTLDKIINPQHFNDMLEMYYHTTLSHTALLIIGVVEILLLVLFFFFNRYKTYTYGFILLAHIMTTLVASWRFFPPFEKHMLLHYAGLPMLAACLLLFVVRDRDPLFKFDANHALGKDVISERIQIALVLLFLSGKFKNWTYAIILFGHTLSTLASTRRFFPPYESHALLYLGGLAMLGACIALYLLRDKDTLLSFQ